MIFKCRVRPNRYDGSYHPFFTVRLRHLDTGLCLALARCERKFVEIDPGGWAGGAHWEWHYRTPAGVYLGKTHEHD